MYQISVFLLIFSFFNIIQCNNNGLTLQIIKCSEDSFTPVSSRVEEKAGANFSLLCDLVSSKTNNNYYDFHISWVKQSNDVRIWRELDSADSTSTKKMYSILKPSEMNKAIKRFNPLRPEDRGKYLCVSLKYNLLEVVEVVVQDDKPSPIEERPFIQETIFCSEQMFQCANGVCIIHHYICDGKADCKDGSDESLETCHGEPCRDKLQCEDGRCIPKDWCCDRHHDPNCTVTNRPKCCQVLSDSYEELGFGATPVSQNHNGARYLFITICTLCILFVILLFLVLASRVVLMARKTDLSHSVSTPPNLESIGLNNQQRQMSCNIYTYQNTRVPTTENHINDCDVSDPLLFTEEDQPPSYLDVIRAQNSRINLNEPPPPYRSREVLNAPVDRSETVN